MRFLSNLLSLFKFKIKFKSKRLKSFKQHFDFIAYYFLHASLKKRIIAWLLAIAIVLCAVASVGLMAVLVWWNAGFFAALIAKDAVMLKTSCIIFTGIMFGFVVINSLELYLTQSLAIRWRKWLSNKLISKYTDEAYLKLQRTKSIDNPGQRIEQDLDTAINNLISLARNFISSLISLITFASTLWTLGGQFAFVAFGFNLVIPGYLFWIAAAYAVVSSVVTIFIGSSLAELTRNKVQSESSYREEAQILLTKAESIALADAGKSYHKNRLKARLKQMIENSYNLLSVSTKLAAFKGFCAQIPYILPYIVSAPIYFAGKIDMGSLMQLSMAFSMVTDSLSWFVNCFESIAVFNASLSRVVELDQEMLSLSAVSDGAPVAITVNRDIDRDDITISDLSIRVTDGNGCEKPILRKLNLFFKKDQHCVIKAETGLGKSTLLKAIAGTWSHGQGVVTTPARDQIYVVPQESYIPDDTLSAVLAYPDPANTYTKEQYQEAIKKVCCGIEEFIEQLEPETATFTPKTNWQTLSGGQKQLIAFARVLLKNPKWVLFDESTSALDVKSEKHVYEQVQQLKGTTMISIAHRSTVEDFHSRVVIFSKKEGDEDTKVEDREYLTKSASSSALAL